MLGDAYASCITEIGSEFGNGDSPTRMAKVLNKPAVIKVHGKGEQQLRFSFSAWMISSGGELHSHFVVILQMGALRAASVSARRPVSKHLQCCPLNPGALVDDWQAEEHGRFLDAVVCCV